MEIYETYEKQLLSDIKAAECFEMDGHLFIKTTETDPDGDIQVLSASNGDIHRYPPDTVVIPRFMQLVSLNKE